MRNRSFYVVLLLGLALLVAGCPTGNDDDDDDSAGDDDTGDDDTAPSLESCMEGSGLAFTCDEASTTQTAVASEEVGCLATSNPGAQVFLTFEMGATEPDGTVHLQELRLQDAGWTNNNDGDRWLVTLDPVVDLGAGDSLPPTLTGTAVLDTYTMAAAFSFLQALLDTVEVTLDAPVTLEQLQNGTTLSGTVTGAGSEFLVFDGTDDSPDPLDDYEWITDPTGEAAGCFHTTAILHPLEVGDP